MNSQDSVTRYMNAVVYGPLPTVDVSASEDWDYVATSDPEWPGHYYRHGDGVRLLKGKVRLSRTEYDWIPDEKAVAELKALMDSWRERGLSNFADSVEIQTGEEGETFSVYESLGASKRRQVSKTFSFSDVRFVKELPHDPVEGLRRLVSEPRANARIIGLGTAGLPTAESL
jgi:hypothetical protein